MEYILALIMAILQILSSLKSGGNAPNGSIGNTTAASEFSSDYTVLSGSFSPCVLKAEITHAKDPRVEADNNVLHRGVVGRFGCPVKVSAKKYSDSEISFYYDKKMLYSLDPENFLILFYDEKSSDYKEFPAKIDKSAGKASASIFFDGVYILVDGTAWSEAWGAQPKSGGEKLFRTESSDFPRFSLDILSEVRAIPCSGDRIMINNAEAESIVTEHYGDEVFVTMHLVHQKPSEFSFKASEWQNTEKFSAESFNNGTLATVKFDFDGYKMAETLAVYPVDDNNYLHIVYVYPYEKADEFEPRAAKSLRTLRFEAGNKANSGIRN